MKAKKLQNLINYHFKCYLIRWEESKNNQFNWTAYRNNHIIGYLQINLKTQEFELFNMNMDLLDSYKSLEIAKLMAPLWLIMKAL